MTTAPTSRAHLDPRFQRIVISGTYSTGKTTTATAVSIATGLPLINALSAREILTDLYPGRKFHHMSATELLALGLRRFEERVRAEAVLAERGGFISDGSVLNEWVYTTVRAKIGINPGANFFQQLVKAVLGLPARPFLKRYMNAYGQVAKIHTVAGYDRVVHLPVEFEMSADGHRPVNEKYRTLSDDELRDAFTDLGMAPTVIGGTLTDRVVNIAAACRLPLVVPADHAVAMAIEQVSSSREAVARKILEQDEPLSAAEAARVTFRF